MTTRAIAIRPARLEDLEFCRAIHQAGGHDQSFAQSFDPAGIQILGLDGREIGFLQTHRESDCIFIRKIILHPSFRSQGIGTRVLSDLIHSAPGDVRRFKLDVLASNPSQKLYGRLGFRRISEREGLLTFELTRGQYD